jgi:hypothetical protein
MSPLAAPLSLEIESQLVERAVELAMRGRHGDPYWRSREALYALGDPEERERRFEALNREAFEALALAAPLHRALEELSGIVLEVERLRVAPARARRDEGAELFGGRGGGAAGALGCGPGGRGPGGRGPRSVLVRLSPEAFLDAPALLMFLRRELYHVADMLDPEFGYDPSLSHLEGGPGRLHLVLGRYRVLWDTVIDGRLFRLGRVPDEARELRRRAFGRAFAMLGERTGEAFARWFEEDHPTHPRLLEFAEDPLGASGPWPLAGRAAGTCPLCGAALFATALPLPPLAEALAGEIQRDFPGWTPAAGACPQCVELYRGRPLSREAARNLPGA